jgi:hypothetical protein
MQQRDGVDAVVRDDDGTVSGGDDVGRWRLVSGDPPTRRPWPTSSSPGGRCAR